MNKTAFKYVFVIIVSAMLAWAVFQKAASPKNELQPVSPGGEDLSDPLWYRSLSIEEKIRAARVRLDTMTSTAIPAMETGPLKDEIALLCQEEGVVDVVVESFKDRQGLSVAELSAYMEIFSRIRHEKFAPLLARGLQDSRFEPNLNAVEAAICQRHPSLVPFLAGQLKNRRGSYSQKILSALAYTATDEALGAIISEVESEDSYKAVYALRTVANAGLKEAIPRIILRLKDGDPEVRCVAAWCMGSLGQSSGVEVLRTMLRDRSNEPGIRAQAAQCLCRLRAIQCIPDLREFADSDVRILRIEARTSLASLGDETTLESLKLQVSSEDQRIRQDALLVLCQAGREGALQWIGNMVPDLDDSDLVLVLRALKASIPTGGAALVVDIERHAPAVSQLALGVLGGYGVAALPAVRKLYRDADGNRDRSLAVLGVASRIVSTDTIEFLEQIDASSDRRKWMFIRQAIRSIEQQLLR